MLRLSARRGATIRGGTAIADEAKAIGAD